MDREEVSSGPQRGRLKVFLGAAAGVGKTYAMLGEARDLKAAGVDVVIGYLEAHLRRFTEMDVDWLLDRKPQLCLVDELAHTNHPGGRHAKRWQDVEELLDADIDVFTTVNIQHLESLNDKISELTGVPARCASGSPRGASTRPRRSPPRWPTSSAPRTWSRCAPWRSARWPSSRRRARPAAGTASGQGWPSGCWSASTGARTPRAWCGGRRGSHAASTGACTCSTSPPTPTRCRRRPPRPSTAPPGWLPTSAPPCSGARARSRPRWWRWPPRSA